MKILRKMISCKNWKIPWKTAVLKFVFVKLQAYCVQDCNSTTSRLHHRFFSEYVPRTTCLIKNTLGKICSVRLCKFMSLKKRWNIWCIGRKTSLVEASCQYGCRSRVCSCNFIKKGIHFRGFLLWGSQGSCFKSFGKISARYICHSSCRPAGCNFTENDVLAKYTKLALNWKAGLYCVKDNIYIWMPMPRFQNGPPNGSIARKAALGGAVKCRCSGNCQKQQQIT